METVHGAEIALCHKESGLGWPEQQFSAVLGIIRNKNKSLNTFVNSQTKIKKFGIMLHWYSGNVNSEKISLREKLKIRLNELDYQKLLQIKEDTFYYIER